MKKKYNIEYFLHGEVIKPGTGKQLICDYFSITSTGNRELQIMYQVLKPKSKRDYKIISGVSAILSF